MKRTAFKAGLAVAGILVAAGLGGCGLCFGPPTDDGGAVETADGGCDGSCEGRGDSDLAGDGGGSNGAGDSTTEQGVEPVAGQLTCGVRDDNANWDFYLGYRERKLGGEAPVTVHDVTISPRVRIEVTDAAGAPVPDAVVTVSADGAGVMVAKTGPDGRVLFFPAADGVAAQYLVTAGGLDLTVQSTFAAPGPGETTLDVGLRLPGTAPALDAMDLAFVIDTTGSMGDEIDYLKSEIKDIVTRIAAECAPDLRLGLVYYRDRGDDYVTRKEDFTRDLEAYRGSIGLLEANGGGDYEESVNEAVAVGVRDLSWREEASSRLLFLVADAPPHLDYAPDGDYAVEMLAARDRGVRIHPVAASGVMDQAEFIFRQMAQTTYGRYLFLTDNSGIGGDHQEPDLGPFMLEYLNEAIVRVACEEVQGLRTTPVSPH